MNVVVSNREHPDYGQITVPLPIPDEEYDHVVEMLNELEIGGVVDRDCHIEEIMDGPPIFQRLVGKECNIDELDYLAKRLDSFDAKELAVYQGMVEKHGYTDIADLINLSFSCDGVTVITNFSEMEAVGRNHVLAKNGAVSVEELERMDLAKIGRELIESGKGTITPYGVIYDEGFQLEQLYTGESFPEYHYKDSVLDVDVFSPFSKNAFSLQLPASSGQIERSFSRAGIDDAYDYSVNYATFLFLADVPDSGLVKDNLYALNDMAAAIAKLSPADQKKYAAVVSFSKPEYSWHFKHLAENLALFDFAPDVKDAEGYGRYMIQESGHFEFDENLEDYYDYAAYGANRIKMEDGVFTQLGYVAYSGTMRLADLMDHGYQQQEMKQQMGGAT